MLKCRARPFFGQAKTDSRSVHGPACFVRNFHYDPARNLCTDRVYRAFTFKDADVEQRLRPQQMRRADD
jgi:hypothetical protein